MNKHKHNKEACDCCALGIDKVLEKEKGNLEKYGWLAHCVRNDPDTPYHFNYHTHGLDVSQKHKNFQVCIPIEPEIIHNIIWNLIDSIRNGKSYEAGDTAWGIIDNYPITFIDAKENGRDVLRVILPDPAGCLDKNEIEDLYKMQFHVS